MCDLSPYIISSAGRFPLALDSSLSAGFFRLAWSVVPTQNMGSHGQPLLPRGLNYEFLGFFFEFNLNFTMTSRVLLADFFKYWYKEVSEVVVSDKPEPKFLLCHFLVKGMHVAQASLEFTL